MKKAELHVGGINGKMKPRDRFVVAVSSLTLIIIIISIFIFTLMSFFPVVVSEIHTVPIPVMNENRTVHVGEQVLLFFNRTVYERSRVETLRSLVCGDVRIELSPIISDNSIGHFEEIKPYFTVHSSMGVGTCYIEMHITKRVNMFREVYDYYESEEFRIS